MLEIEDDVPDDHRLTLVGPGWGRGEQVRRGVLTLLLLAVALGSLSLGFASVELLVLSPLGVLMVVGVAGVQPEQVTRLELRRGELRITLRGRWIWGRRAIEVRSRQLARVSVSAHDVGPLGPAHPELGLAILADGRRVPEVSVRGVERYDEALSLAHRMALALELGVRSSRSERGLTCLVDRDGVPPPPPEKIASDGYRGTTRTAPLDLSRTATYRAPDVALTPLEDTAHAALTTPLSQDAAGWHIRGERPWAKLFGFAVLAAAPWVAGAVFSDASWPGTLRPFAALTIAVPVLWLLAPRLSALAVSPWSWLLGLYAPLFPRSPQLALHAGGALPDRGGVFVRRGLRLARCSTEASVFLVRRVPPRKSTRGERPLGACWGEVWVHDRARWSLLAKGRPQEPPIPPVVEALAHEAARRLDTPVRFSQQRG